MRDAHGAWPPCGWAGPTALRHPTHRSDRYTVHGHSHGTSSPGRPATDWSMPHSRHKKSHDQTPYPTSQASSATAAPPSRKTPSTQHRSSFSSSADAESCPCERPVRQRTMHQRGQVRLHNSLHQEREKHPLQDDGKEKCCTGISSEMAMFEQELTRI